MIALVPIQPESAAAFKSVRLRALLDSPTAFGATHAGESQLTDAQWLHRARQCAGEANAGFLAMDGDTACGLVRATPDDQSAAVAWVESMWVAPSHRKQGVGRLLVNQIVVWARAKGLRTLKLSVTSNNEPAIRFYRGLGFIPTGQTEPYPHDPALVECEMALKLVESG